MIPFPVQNTGFIIPALPSLPSYLGSLLEDDVAVFDDAYNQMFPMARAIKVNVTPTSKLMDHPIEDGSLQTDFRVIQPQRLELSVICTGYQYFDVFQQIKSLYLSGAFCTITTRADTYFNFVVEAMPHDETPDMNDVLAVGIRFREVILIKTQYQPLSSKDVKSTNDQSTVKTGMATPSKVTQTASVLAKWFPGVFK